MKNSTFQFDEVIGEVKDGNIRYLLMRPDVLMGTLHHIDDSLKPAVLEAMSKSAYENGRKSLITYKERGIEDPYEFLSYTCKVAPKLGWGSWSYSLSENQGITLTVKNSPFSFGFGRSSCPVCAPISGILSALYKEIFEIDRSFVEVKCASQGNDTCIFKELGDIEEDG